MRRQAAGQTSGAASEPIEGTPATIEVYSGLYVNEANDPAKAGPEEDSVFSEKVCICRQCAFLSQISVARRFLESH